MIEQWIGDHQVRFHVDTADPAEIQQAQMVLELHGLRLTGATSNPSTLSGRRIPDSEIADALREFVRVLGPGGEPSIEPPGDLYGRTVADLTKMSSEIGIHVGSIWKQADSIASTVATVARDLHSDVQMKVPISTLLPGADTRTCDFLDGLQAVERLSQQYSVNGTLYFNPMQALLGTLAGVKKVSIFVGRKDDALASTKDGYAKEKNDYFPLEGIGTTLADGTVSGVDVVVKSRKLLRLHGLDADVVFPASIREPRSAYECIIAGVTQLTMPLGVLEQLMEFDGVTIATETQDRLLHLYSDEVFGEWNVGIFAETVEPFPLPRSCRESSIQNQILQTCMRYLADPLTRAGMYGFSKDAIEKGQGYLKFLHDQMPVSMERNITVL